jgi:hypothetical protein
MTTLLTISKRPAIAQLVLVEPAAIQMITKSDGQNDINKSTL